VGPALFALECEVVTLGRSDFPVEIFSRNLNTLEKQKTQNNNNNNNPKQ
jgi:hypothetical protein